MLDDGELVGIGTHDELLAACEVYREIYYSQYPDERQADGTQTPQKAAPAADRSEASEEKVREGGGQNGGR